MAILAPLAVSGVHGSLVVSGDPAATFNDIADSQGLFLLTAWVRLAFAAVFAAVLVNLLEAADLVAGANQSTLDAEQLHAQVMSLLDGFDVGWAGIALAIFGLHLFGLGYLLFKSVEFPKFLGVLVLVAGGGYVFDSFGVILIAEYAPTVATFTFIGEALLIFWLGWRAIKGFGEPINEYGFPPRNREFERRAICPQNQRLPHRHRGG